jgi:hypothetical protein
MNRWESFIGTEAARICDKIAKFLKRNSEWAGCCKRVGLSIEISVCLLAIARAKRGYLTVPIGGDLVQATRFLTDDEVDIIANLIGSQISGHNLRVFRESSTLDNVLIYTIKVRDYSVFKKEKS